MSNFFAWRPIKAWEHGSLHWVWFVRLHYQLNRYTHKNEYWRASK